jgi:hypothetical protein
MNSDDTDDYWGRPLRLVCFHDMPAGTAGIVVMSKGEDGADGTNDDIASWSVNPCSRG